MNHTIETILNHRSIRKFKDKALSEQEIHTLVSAAQHASTSSFVMAYTIIGVTDPDIKAELRKVSGQKWVENNGHLFVFCGDLHRVQERIPEEEAGDLQVNIESTEQFIVTIIDAALAAQTMAIAAESLGLGICYLGSLRNDINRVNELLELPDHVIPLFGMAVGYPDHDPEVKPRLPFEAVYHENKYKPIDEQAKLLDQYDEELKAYYENRSFNQKLDTWSKQMTRKYSKATRLDVGPFVESKKLNLR